MVAMTLVARNNPLASADAQLARLGKINGCAPFAHKMRDIGLAPLHATGITVFQVNVGKFCNQTCRHCHVDAGPERTEQMSRATAQLCINAFSQTDIPTLDITGGAPELNPSFRWMVEQASALGRHVIDRCNLSILLTGPQRDLGEFLARHRVEVIASLPYFRSSQTDAQRGDGVFDKSIEALQLLNRLGYGVPGSGLTLNLVHNPVGAFLPPKQEAIEAQFRRELARQYDIKFNNLYTITNMPISRFLEFLLDSGNFEGYMERLVNAFNPGAASGVMCRYPVSVGWDGKLYDCDFNQMLELPLAPGLPRHIRDFDVATLGRRSIVTANHCYGCTAGAGSSCGGSVV
jgi:radical SAM/Cys-rich protein